MSDLRVGIGLQTRLEPAMPLLGQIAKHCKTKNVLSNKLKSKVNIRLI